MFIRTLLVDSTINLEKLHLTIAKSFGFKGQEMASFYRTDEEWIQGEEIPLFNMEEISEVISMQTCTLNTNGCPRKTTSLFMSMIF